MRYLQQTKRGLLRTAFAPKTQRELSNLQTDRGARFLSSALAATLQRTATLEERVWVDKIESLRERLHSSSVELEIVDFGARRPERNLSGAQMYRGEVATRTIGDICTVGSKSRFWAFLLFKLVREFGPSVCLELGTCLGISACYQAAALKMNHKGRLLTLEGAPSLASLSRQHFQALDLDNITVVAGRFQDTLPGVLAQYGPIDYAFVDGHHDEKATLSYFEQILAFLPGRALLVFDDISYDTGMKRAWAAIEGNARIKRSIDLQTVGICVVDTGAEQKRSYRIPWFEASAPLRP